MINAKDQVFGVGIVFNIDFAELQAAVLHERLSAAAIRAPGSGIHDDRFGWCGGAHTGLDAEHFVEVRIGVCVLPGRDDIDALMLLNDLDAHEGALQSHGSAVPINIFGSSRDAFLSAL